ncbi:MAG TPA: hypothetical protein VFA75_20130 [Nevskia sp.]|nr:hypothetical protein [Nevskia sp.]
MNAMDRLPAEANRNIMVRPGEQLMVVSGAGRDVPAIATPDGRGPPRIRPLRANRLRRAIAIGLAVCPALVSAVLAQSLDRWELFERAGSITTAIGLLLASRRHIRYGVLELATLQTRKPQLDVAEITDDIHSAKLGLALSAFGTIVWGWGVYLGWWSFSCLLIWAVLAARDRHRDAYRARMDLFCARLTAATFSHGR